MSSKRSGNRLRNAKADCDSSKLLMITGEALAAAASTTPFIGDSLAAVPYGLKFTSETAYMSLYCDDVPFEMINEDLEKSFQETNKNVTENIDATIVNRNAIRTNLEAIHKLQKEMEEEFRKVGKQLDKILYQIYQNYYEIQDASQNVDRNYAAIQKNMEYIKRNYESIIEDAAETDEILKTVENAFYEVIKILHQSSNIMTDGFKVLENLARRRKMQDNNLELLTSLKEFTEVVKDLAHGDRVKKLTRDYQKSFKYGKCSESKKSLYTQLYDILNDGTAVPNGANDDTAFTVLYLLYSGTETYLRMLHFSLMGNVLTAEDNYRHRDFDKFNDNYREITAVVRELQNTLCGVGRQVGLISEVISVLEHVRGLHFMNEVPHTSAILAQKIKYFRDVKQRISNLRDDREQPLNKIRYNFNLSAINTPFLEWKNTRKVRYAIQYVQDGVLSPVSQWSVPYTIDGKGCPELNVGIAPPGTSRVIFRQIGRGKALLVGIVEDPDQTKFRDVDRDFYDAVLEGNQNLARLNAAAMIDNGANVTAAFENGKQAIHAAAKAANLEVLRDLLKKGADINARDATGYTPLHIAAESENEKLVQGIIGLGADVRAQTHLNWTALHVAAKRGHVETLKVLQQAKGINLNARAAGGFTPLHIAVNSRKGRAVEWFISKEKANVNAPSEKFMTPLHLAILSLDRGMVKVLLSHDRCDVNAKTQGGLTALHLAAVCGDENIVKQLVNHPAVDVSAKSEEGWSPLHLAIALKTDGVTETLLNITEIGVSDLQDRDEIQPKDLGDRRKETLTMYPINALKSQDSTSYTTEARDASKEIIDVQDQMQRRGTFSHSKTKSSFDAPGDSKNVNNYSIPVQEDTFEKSQNLSTRVSFLKNFDWQAEADVRNFTDHSTSLLPSLNNSILLYQWLLKMFGQKSILEGMKKVMDLVRNVQPADIEWAENFLRQGIARYGQEN